MRRLIQDNGGQRTFSTFFKKDLFFELDDDDYQF